MARWRRQTLQQLGPIPNSAVDRLLPAGLARRRAWVLFLQVAGLFFMVLALAGPLIGTKLMEFRQKGLDVLMAVDCSLSMQAQDFKPSRMAHAKLVLGQMIDRLGGSRIGVIAFAGQAYLQCPLTIDQNAARDTLDTLDSGAVPIAGTKIGDAIRLAVQGLKAGEGGNRVLVLLTDGEDHQSDPLSAAKEASKAGVKVFTIGIGNAEGEPIPVFNDKGERTGYKRDRKGEVVLSRVDEKTLETISRETQGQYFRAGPGGDEVEPLLRELEKLQGGDRKTQMFNRYENRFQWPLAVALTLLLISLAIPEMGFRR